MRVAVASQGPELSSRVDPRFGRAPYIVIGETGRPEPEVIDNRENSQQAGGAGVAAAETVVSRRVDMIVSQNFGPKALKVFSAAGVKAAVFSDGTVAEAIEAAMRGQLPLI